MGGRRRGPERGRAQLTHGEVIAALVANRLSAPAPLYDVAGWASTAAMPSCSDVPRCCSTTTGSAGRWRRSRRWPRRVRGEWRWPPRHAAGPTVAAAPGSDRGDRCPGGYQGSALVAKGWAADRTIARQVKTLQASTRTGVAVYYARPLRARPTEAPCFAEALDHIRELAPPGLSSVRRLRVRLPGPLCAADRAGLRFVVPLRADTGLTDWFAADIDGGIDALGRLRLLLPPRTTTARRAAHPLDGRAARPRGH